MKYNFIHACNVCNAKCWFCMQKSLSYRKVSPKDYLKVSDLDLSIIPTNLDVLEITGLGEPTLNPEIEEISKKVAKFCRKNGILSSGYTNGHNLSAYKHLQDVNISVHSPTIKGRIEIFGSNFLNDDKIKKFLGESVADTIQVQFILAKKIWNRNSTRHVFCH